uniref:Anoctamin n=1 Tax=Hirondellea gigas TaxID=1518452 RepID=A0A6A7G539_9CRUS
MEFIPESSFGKQSFSWTYCMVFSLGTEDSVCEENNESDKKDSEEQQSEQKPELNRLFLEKVMSTLASLQEAGLCYTCYKSIQEDEIYCLIGISEQRCKVEAERSGYELMLNVDLALDFGLKLNCRLASVTLDDNDSNCTKDHWENIYLKYEKSDHDQESIYCRYDDDENYPNSLFTSSDRLKLIVSVVEADVVVGGAGLQIGHDLLNENHPINAFFPLHQDSVKKELESEWNPFLNWCSNPYNRIRDYFGEYFALYFVFLWAYQKWLILLAVVGIPFTILQFQVGFHNNVPGMWILSVVVSIWACLFIKHWKRTEAKYRSRWGQTHFLLTEQPRPEFNGEYKSSVVTGQLMSEFSTFERLKRMVFSQTIIITTIACVVGVVIGMFVIRHKQRGDEYAQYYLGIVNGIQIQVLNYFYGRLAVRLNQYENHRTDSEYENALIAKSFIFKFVNSFNTLFYIAFVKQHIDGCDDNDCQSELRIQLAMVFGTQIILGNLSEMLTPYLTTKWKTRQETKNIGSKSANELVADMTAPERQFLLEEVSSTFDDFDEMIIQFGYVTLFFVAFPLVSIFAIANNCIEVLLDSRKFLRLCRRPEPRGVYSIGTWYAILQILAVIAVVTNVAVVTFTSGQLRDFSGFHGENVNQNGYSPNTNVWIFVVSEHFLLLFKFCIQYFISDEPESVKNHRARQEYLLQVLVNRVDTTGKEIEIVLEEQLEAGSVDSTKEKTTTNESYEEKLDTLAVGYETTERHWC